MIGRFWFQLRGWRDPVDLPCDPITSAEVYDPSTDRPIWTVAFARYDFADASRVPEPATLMLLGAAGAVAALRRNQQAS